MTQRFDLVLTGRVLPGQSLEAVAAGLAKLLRIDEPRARAILSGRETVVKRGQTREALEPFVDALTKIGAEPALRATVPAPPAGQAPGEAGPAPGPKRAARTLPGPPPVATPDEDTRPWILTFYKKSLLVEILVFLILTLWWATCAMIDPHRGKLVRGVATLLFALMAVGMVLRASGFLDDREGEALDNAFAYAGEVADKVGSYAIENQRMPEDSAELSLPPRPRAVKAVEVRRGGSVQFTLADDLRESSGGAIVISPSVKEGVINWSCSTRGIPERYLGNCR